MRMKLRQDVVLEHVAGEYVLVALRSAWYDVPFVRSVPQKHVELFHCLEMGLSDDKMLEHMDPDRKIPENRLVKTYHAIKEGKLYKGYLLEIKE